MTIDAPLSWLWDGEVLRPASPHWARQCDKVLVIGERYDMVEYHPRSQKTHAHYFASVHQAWQNLPESIAPRYPTEEHLRKEALIRKGFYDGHTLVCSSKTEALRVASFIRPTDEYAIVTVTGCAVERFTAKSQSMKAMGAKEFQRSKDAVLEYISDLIGTTKPELAQAGAA